MITVENALQLGFEFDEERSFLKDVHEYKFSLSGFRHLVIRFHIKENNRSSLLITRKSRSYTQYRSTIPLFVGRKSDPLTKVRVNTMLQWLGVNNLSDEVNDGKNLTQ